MSNRTSTAPINREERNAASSVLTKAILGLAFAMIPVINIAGFVLAIMALVQVKKFRKTYGRNNGSVTAGLVIAIIALVIAIATIAYWGIIVFFYAGFTIAWLS